MPPYGYPRTSGLPLPALRFGEPSVLDAAALADRWNPWIRLADSTTAPLRARHAVHLLRMLDEGPPPRQHWFGMVSVTTARSQVVCQSRAGRHLCDRPEELPDELRADGWRLLVERLDHWTDQDTDARTTIVALLTQLGFHRFAVRLVPRPPVGDRREQQLAYEVSRAAHQLNRMADPPFTIFGWLAANAEHPVLRLLSALQFVSNQVREHKNTARAKEWLGTAGRLSTELTGPDWLVHLGRSRHHRAAALYYSLVRQAPAAAKHLTTALHHDDVLAELATGEVQRHYQRENRRLVLEAAVKLETMSSGIATAPVNALDQLADLDPFDPDTCFTIGAFHESRSRWAEAAEAYLRAAAGGTVRGAHAAYQAGRCLEKIDAERANLAYGLCRDLDPAADVPLIPADDLASGRAS